ncbi:MAG TPA: ABC transporter permease [Blastocatellia bacterium]|nr:ABC transporter permease [Blastocatellia bacterium]
MASLIQDARYAVKMMLRKPAFTIIAVFVLALGIGANTAIFSIVNAVLLRPLPYPQPEMLVQLWETVKNKGDNNGTLSAHNFAEWREMSGSFEHMAAYRYSSFTLTGGDRPEWISGAQVSSTLFRVLGVAPAIGRDFALEEDAPGHNRVAILSHGLWQRRFASDENLIGQSLTLNGESFTVVGVMPKDFQFPNSVDIWSPLGIDLSKQERGNHFLMSAGRLKPGVTIMQAQSEMDSIATLMEERYPDNNTGRGISLVPLHEELYGDFRPALLLLLAAVALVLLIACANVANLLLTRAMGRQKEIAIRAAMGANRWRLLRQFLTESLLLALAGCGLGLLLSMWAIDLLIASSPGTVPRASAIELDAAVLGYTIAVSLITGIIFGLAPALQVTAIDLNEALKESRQASLSGPGRRRLGGLLVVSEIALALMLLVGAGLLINSFYRLQRVAPGFETENVLTMTVSLPRNRYPDGQKQGAFFERALERIVAIEGVEAAGAVSELPFSGSRTRSSFAIEGRPQSNPGEGDAADRRAITPDYFKAMGIPLIAGRYFNDRDRKESQPAIIINQAMARAHWPGEDPIGKRVRIGGPEETAIYGEPVWREIVGIVGDLKHDRLTADAPTEMYLPYLQAPPNRMFLAVRGSGNMRGLAGAVQGAILEVDKDQPVYNIRTMEQRLQRAVAPQRFIMFLLGIFAGGALLLAAIGIYGVMSYSVVQRTNEIGIRMALGADRRDIFRLIVGQGMKLMIIGTAIGIAGSLMLTRLMKTLLYGVSTTDPLTYTAVTIVLGAVALLACYIPARRATKVDPMVALRYE